MEDMLLRFPHIAGNIFGELDDLSMINSKEVSKLWRVFLDEEKVQWYRILQKYAELRVKFWDEWKMVIKNTPAEIIKTLAIGTHNFFEDNPKFVQQKLQMYPISIIAGSGCFNTYLYVSEKYKKMNMWYAWPLDHAARAGHLELCKLIIANTQGIAFYDFRGSLDPIFNFTEFHLWYFSTYSVDCRIQMALHIISNCITFKNLNSI